MSKIKCFGCSQLGHYVSQCPNRKKGDKEGKETTTATNIEDLSSKLEDEFFLIACLSSFTSTSLWYIGSGVLENIFWL